MLEEKSLPKLFGRYLKQHKKGIFTFFLFVAVFAAAFALYRLPIGAVLYPVLLCLLIGAGLMAWDFAAVVLKHRRLNEIKRLTAAMISELPEACTIAEADCQEIIRRLQNELAELGTQSSAQNRDMMDYYTAWAHQIKTPIVSMQLALQNEDTSLSRRLSAELFRIEQYAEMVLAFLRLQSPDSDYVFEEHSVDALIRQAVARFAAEFIDRKIGLSFEPTGMTVVTDEKWFIFVLEQVLSNALKYTREGGIKIYRCEPDMLCIEDTGIGIAPEDLPRIFEKGYTGYNGRIDRRASGIGLYLCKRVCDNLSAEIRVTSELDRGTTVCIDLSQYDIKE